jgi:inner membrane protein
LSIIIEFSYEIKTNKFVPWKHQYKNDIINNMLFFGHVGIAAGVVYAGGELSKKGTFLNKLDLRAVIVGSVLPDIIDKPVGLIFFKNVFSNGRIFSHTLLFLALISFIGFLLYKTRKESWILALAIGTSFHLVLDQMWLLPSTLLWPGYGWQFPTEESTGWVASVIHYMFTKPVAYVPELIGLGILILLGLRAVHQKKFRLFLSRGQL